MKVDVKVTITFAPKPWILRWSWAEEARMSLAAWLVQAGLRVSGSSEMIVTPHLWRKDNE
jgi:hypothetical protein